MDEVTLFIHGSCHFSTRLNKNQVVGDGGYGVVVNINGETVHELSSGYSNTTNARMDIMAVTAGLKYLTHPSKITCYLSNGYVIDTLTKGWLEKWKKTGFKQKKHADLWIELDKVMQRHAHIISFQHSKNLASSKDYQRAAQLSKLAATQASLPTDLEIEDNLLFETTDSVQVERVQTTHDRPILDSICVDAATSRNPGPTEYRGVDTQTKKILFSMKYDEATNNIGEFLAIVHALALYQKNREKLNIVYSDSLIAISWVKQKKCKTKYPRNEHNQRVFDHIDRAVKWLENNEYDTKILKWNTAAWGQIPADYGRK
jgi:ribonuclease HI